ncbi:TPA: PTS sugar transporter subunit IIA [Enterococcus faecium]|jgi:PTS system mannose-specific IIA component|uniref:PTS sugar transporter subunit IIA n=1 Tax=Bacteria TaxID=2 RepID=UPI000A349D83|nr:PTS fructose transporter subunit IIA [Enterococcus faecium]MDN3045675.1 PTS fructose transporter subunit IIA [Enterococcus faecium]MDQ8216056.1 PTS fructose transporter subunit IIA [Enterococcus faecium]MDQ8220909.1 PTS fructose transporter subunit IIA [Enterococcus faecium]MDQ8260333.1 PTS fructose transporter subunit IIA [Enterococcus faecium]MDQ8277341.1 PTS fructose transporter subunit IIA [Enterococcus faecium]
MGKQLVLISHGLFCEELKKSTEMIMGAQESIHTVSLFSSELAEDFRKKFETVIANLDDFVVLADLMGGTPCNVVSKIILEGQAIDLYAGMNMPMVIDFLTSQLIGTEFALIESATSNICYVNEQIFSDEDDEDE